MFSKTQKCILYDVSFNLLETVKTFWGDDETIKNFGTFTGCEKEAVIFICTGWGFYGTSSSPQPVITSFFLEPITRAKEFLAIVSVLDSRYESEYEALTTQLRLVHGQLLI